MMGLKRAKLENYFPLSSEPLLVNVQLGEGTSFSNRLNKGCNYLLVCVCVCVCVCLCVCLCVFVRMQREYVCHRSP